ncbi:UbiA prenyltransferase family-domain-containing protein [Gilbertella persicaria]|uniref:UbiA prenyltransferase family-domain-containing protein n=1 Tax=Gilbertella persicaria TaxID=101096 RepID=UPI00221E4822|nr:UbiA prenyltransferase family-domain-containing protein [Gilbertella persicaria]KAI8062804.1 UbiA prenyltransferase family-domain-containing protein [Gilbertella persicaria]
MYRSSLTILSRHKFKSPQIARLCSCPTVYQQWTDTNNTRVTKYKVITTPTSQQLPSLYKELVKFKLAALVTLTTMAGYAIAPGESTVTTLLATTLGTGLCIGSANAINQWIETPYDAQMLRTRNRVLGRRALSQAHAFGFGCLTGVSGVSLLASCVNPLTACLGAANIVLYTGIYTPMKRSSIANTWVGAVVGAIPPMMGYTAVTNTLMDPAAWILGGILYAWQFPHFNALAWNLRADYSKAGYRMMAVTDPKLNARVSLRYSLAMFPLCWAVPYFDMTSWWFALDSTVVNGVLAWGAVKFWRNSNDKSGKQLFFGSVIHLPVLLALLMVHKQWNLPGHSKKEEEEEWVEEE